MYKMKILPGPGPVPRLVPPEKVMLVTLKSFAS